MVQSTNNDEARGGGLTLKGDELIVTISQMRRMRTIVDPRVIEYLDSLIALAELARSYTLNPARSQAGLRQFTDKCSAMGARIASAKEKIVNNPAIVEEFNR